MKVERIKYKRVSPKSSVELSKWKVDLGGGFDRLLKAVARVIEKHFGILYMNKFANVFI